MEDRDDEDHKDQRPPDAVREDAVEAVRGRDLEAGRVDDRRRQGAAAPRVAGGDLQFAQIAALLAEAGSALAQQERGRGVGLGKQGIAQRSAGVQQETLDEPSGGACQAGERTARALQGGMKAIDFLVEGLRKQPGGGRTGGGDGTRQRVFQLGQPHGAIGSHRHHGYAEVALECRRPDANAVVFGHVEHVQGEYGGKPQAEHLAEQVEAAGKIAGVGDAEDGVDRRRIGLTAEKHVERDHFVAGTGSKTVQAGQIDEREAAAQVLDQAGLLLDGHARIIADALMNAGQGAEQRGLASVGIADEGDGERFRLTARGHGDRIPPASLPG